MVLSSRAGLSSFAGGNPRLTPGAISEDTTQAAGSGAHDVPSLTGKRLRGLATRGSATRSRFVCHRAVQPSRGGLRCGDRRHSQSGPVGAVRRATRTGAPTQHRPCICQTPSRPASGSHPNGRGFSRRRARAAGYGGKTSERPEPDPLRSTCRQAGRARSTTHCLEARGLADSLKAMPWDVGRRCIYDAFPNNSLCKRVLVMEVNQLDALVVANLLLATVTLL